MLFNHSVFWLYHVDQKYRPINVYHGSMMIDTGGQRPFKQWLTVVMVGHAESWLICIVCHDGNSL